MWRHFTVGDLSSFVNIGSDVAKELVLIEFILVVVGIIISIS